MINWRLNPFIKEAYAVPSRVMGLLRYLVTVEGKDTQSSILAHCSPPSLNEKDDMIKKVVTACVNAGLVARPDKDVELTDAFQKTLHTHGGGVAAVAAALRDCCFESSLVNADDQASCDFSHETAWFLCLSPREIEISPTGIENLTHYTGMGRHLLGLNAERLHQLCHWMHFLHFALKDQHGLIPDASVYLRWLLSRMKPDRPLAISEFLTLLSRHVSFFEGGHLRDEIDSGRQANILSWSTSNSLLRLESEGLIKLTRESDAEMYTFKEYNGDTILYSRLQYLGGAA